MHYCTRARVRPAQTTSFQQLRGGTPQTHAGVSRHSLHSLTGSRKEEHGSHSECMLQSWTSSVTGQQLVDLPLLHPFCVTDFGLSPHGALPIKALLSGPDMWHSFQ